MTGKWIERDGQLVEEETGEIFALRPLPLRKARIGSNFWMMALHAGEVLAGKRELSGQDFRVFMFLTSRLDYDNIVRVTQALVAEHMKISRPAVSASITRLTDSGVIHRIDRGTYQLDPYLGYRGNAANHRKLMKDRGLSVVKGAKKDQS